MWKMMTDGGGKRVRESVSRVKGQPVVRPDSKRRRSCQIPIETSSPALRGVCVCAFWLSGGGRLDRLGGLQSDNAVRKGVAVKHQ